MPLCTQEKLQCVKNISIDESGCLHKCSGLLVTSFDHENIESFLPNLAEYMKSYDNFFQTMRKELKGELGANK